MSTGEDANGNAHPLREDPWCVPDKDGKIACPQCREFEDPLGVVDALVVLKQLRKASSLVGLLLTDARITKGGLCTGEFVSEAQADLIRALRAADQVLKCP
jgi:hypothetical protein